MLQTPSGKMSLNQPMLFPGQHIMQACNLSQSSCQALLHCFHYLQKSKSVAMMRHSLDIVKKAVEHLNPSQKPVVTFDQPLFALAKQFSGVGQTVTGRSILLLCLVVCIQKWPF